MAYNQPGQSSATSYIFERARADILFLHSQQLLDNQAKDTILSKLGEAASRATSSGNPAPPPTDAQVAHLTDQFGGSLAVTNKPAPPVVPVRTGGYDANDTRERARALWNYQGSQPDDLSFTKGDTIVIVAKENEHWWRGSVQGDNSGRVGLFPSNHVEALPHEAATNGGYPNQVQVHHVPPPPNQSYYGAEQEKASMQPYQQQPPPQQYYQPPPPQQYYAPQQQVTAPVPSPNTDSKKNKFKLGGNGFGNTLAHAGVGGLGFGAGSAVGSGIINSIF